MDNMNDYIMIDRKVVLDAINIGLSGYITNDDKLFLEGMGLAVSGMPGELTCDGCKYKDKISYDLCLYCCRGYDDYYEEMEGE